MPILGIANSKKTKFVLGDIGPGGGFVFYDAGSTLSWGRYLEVAPVTWYGGASTPQLAWSANTTTLVTGTSRTFGTGSANTTLIIAQNSTAGYAATASRAYNGGGYTDWFLGDYGQHVQMWANKAYIGGYPSFPGYHWASSNTSATIADIFTINGGNTSSGKGALQYVRPIRAFV